MSATDYGLIGHPLGHSLSPQIHAALLAAAGLPGRYDLFDIRPDQLPDTVRRLGRETLGFNCTIPYKEKVMELLDSLDPVAGRIRAVNTVWHNRGFNTDYDAFRRDCPLKPGDKVLILGAGGVSRTMAFAAADSGCVISIAARRPQQARDLARAVREACPDARITCPETLDAWRLETGSEARWVVLNGTPVGLWPHVNEMPLAPDDLACCRFVYDTIYNPVATRLVLTARSRGIRAKGGLGMLFGQALAAQKIWNPKAVFPEPALARVRAALEAEIWRQFPLTVLLSGFMGSGKSTVGCSLARQMNLPFVDLDEQIEREAGKSIPDIFARDGEAAFRSLERKLLEQLVRKPESKILATGGGALTGPGIASVLEAAPVRVVYLDVAPDELLRRLGQGRGRPMLAGKTIGQWLALYAERRPRYLDLADLVIDAAPPAERVASTIKQSLGLEESL